jgi:hypothetical protein
MTQMHLMQQINDEGMSDTAISNTTMSDAATSDAVMSDAATQQRSNTTMQQHNYAAV